MKFHPKIQAVLDELSRRASAEEDPAVHRAHHEAWILLQEASHEIRMESIAKSHAARVRKIHRSSLITRS